MARLSPAEIYRAARAAGFDRDGATTWTAIALAESGGNAAARNPKGEDSRGLWQINVNPAVRPNKWGDLYDPLTNARAAFEISGGGRNMQPWTVTHAHNQGTSRDFRRYLDDARRAATEVGDGGPGGFAAAAQAMAAGSDGSTHYRPVPGAALVDSWHAPRSGGRVHEGIDLMADEGTPILAITSGKIVQGFEGGPLGGVVVRLQGDDGRYYYYAHLQKGSVDHLEVGQRVEAGQQIGAVGSTGNAAGGAPHLHLGIKENGEWINPHPFLEPLPEFDGEVSDDFGSGPDADGDGLDDEYEIARGLDPNKKDTDGDGILDRKEIEEGLNPLSADTDDDGLSDSYELLKTRTDATAADTDGDGLLDAVELRRGSDPRRGTPRSAADFGIDPDSPEANTDSDDDGLSDAYEIALGLDPANPDSDGDGLLDAAELRHGTNPLEYDTDGDGFGDHSEVLSGTDPLTAEADLVDDPPLPTDHDHDHDVDDALT
jgi:murein DD-endopeptidase MepM/ murein hydrolase activator NlpD